MANGATYVSPRPAIKLKGAPNDDMVTSLLDIAVRAPEAGMASAESKYPPAKPGALGFEPLKAAWRAAYAAPVPHSESHLRKNA